MAVPFESFAFVAARLALAVDYVVASAAADLLALAGLLLVASWAVQLEALVVHQRIAGWAGAGHADSVLHLLVGGTCLLVAAVADSDFSWTALDGLAHSVDVLLADRAGHWVAWGHDH